MNIWSLGTLSKHYSVNIKGSFIHTFRFSKARNYELFVLTCDAKVKVFGLEKKRAVDKRELIKTHDNFISDIAFIGNQGYIVTAGGDRMVNVWDFWMRVKKAPEARQQYKGHACPIYTIVSDNRGNLYTAGGSEGIFKWAFQDSVNRWASDVSIPTDDVRTNNSSISASSM